MRINTCMQYLHRPGSRDLMIQEKCEAYCLSIFLGIFTLGTAQLISYCLEKRRVSHELKRHKGKQKRYNEVLTKTDSIGKNTLTPSSGDISEKRKFFGSLIQNNFIDSHYGKAFPKRKNVLVPHPKNNEMVRWGTLSMSQKVQVNNKFAHKHTRLKGLKKIFAEFYVVPPGQNTSYLKNDPRKIHGNDHCARVSIFSAVFASLYMKHHPDCKLSEEDLFVIQLVAAGHDSGRNSDGTDVWDKQSADNTVEKLRSMGFADEVLLAKCHRAILAKDAEPNAEKSFIAKCVQNADCADFPRLNLSSPGQSKRDFKHSRGYLDIYKELSGNENLVFELDAVRAEMNELIYKTSRRSMRAQLSQPGNNVYDETLRQITPHRYPLLYKTLVDMGVMSVPHPDLLPWRNEVDGLEMVLNQPGGLTGISEKQYQNFMSKIKPPESLKDSLRDPHVPKSIALQHRLQNLLALQYAAEASFKKNLNEFELMNVFEILSAGQKDFFRSQLIREINISGAELAEKYPSTFADIQHANLLKRIDTLAPAEKISTAKAIIENYNNIAEQSLRDSRQLTTAALLYKQAASDALLLGNKSEAISILKKAGELIPVNDDLKNLYYGTPSASNEVYTVLRGGSHFRHHRLRVSETDIKGERHLQLSFELPLAVRNDLQQYIALLKNDENIKVTKIPAVYHPKQKGETLIAEPGMAIGDDYLIRFESGIEFGLVPIENIRISIPLAE